MPARKEQITLTGSLTCTAGIFLSGLAAFIILIFLHGDADYQAFVIPGVFFSLLYFFLQIICAGMPFSIFSVVQEYWKKRDYKAVFYIRRIMFILNVFFGILNALVIGACGLFLTDIFMCSPEQEGTLFWCTLVSAAAVLIMHVLYGMRGFYQGIGRSRQDHISQCIESGSMGISILVMSIFFRPHETAGYSSFCVILLVLAAVSLLIALLYYIAYDRIQKDDVVQGMKMQIIPTVSQKKVFQDIIRCGVAGAVNAALFFAVELSTVILFPYFTKKAASLEILRGIGGLTDFFSEGVIHLFMIPAVVFANSCVLRIREAFARKSDEVISNNMEEAINKYLYVILPVVFSSAILSPQIIHILGGNILVEEQARLFVWTGISGLMFGLAMITHWFMNALEFVHEAGIYSAVAIVIKIAAMYLLAGRIGYEGVLISSVIAYGIIFFLDISKIRNYHSVSLAKTYLRLAKMMVACMCMNGIFAIMKYAGWNALGEDTAVCLMQFAGMILAGTFIYLYVTNVMAVPKGIFHRNLRLFGRDVLKQ